MKRILVTGGAHRVGRRLVERLSAAGHAVVIHANSSVAEAETLATRLKAANLNTWTVSGDLADSAAALSLIDRAAERVGAPLSALVNNASVFDYDTPAHFDAAVFDRALAINLRAPIQLAERFAAQADPLNDNCIVNFLDQKLWNPNPDFFSYTLTKAGLLSATELMARSFAPSVRVCAIAPGLLLPSFDQTQQEFEKVASINAMGRTIDLDDVAHALEFILANRALTGQVIHVDNGQRLVQSARDVIFRDSQ